ncbi:hypothetical protein IJG73_01285 [Candidatus Saccharibacteria bacterium]|nr:hypothetical protein [Candidatus Saccharibacteria bacterium]
MNKDVIYIEPEDDITDIINQLKSAKQKVVALVPPKKLGVLRSAVNTRLIAKTATEAEKSVVIVTTDPSLMKLSAAAKIPVAKSLQSRPVIPSDESIASASDDVDETIEEESPASPTDATNTDAADATEQSDAKQPDEVINSTELEEDLADAENSDQKSDKKSKKDKKVPNFDKYRKWIILGIIGGVLLIAFLVWAFVFAPAAKIIVSIRTTAANFSENVSFVFKQEEEDIKAGKFYLEEQKLETKASTEVAATGKKNVGEKATGTISVHFLFGASSVDGDSVTIPAGTVFSHGGLKYVSVSPLTLSYKVGDCSIGQVLQNYGCPKAGKVNAQAAEPGAAYNIGPQNSGWSISGISGATASNAEAFTGGTDKEITVLTENDVNKAKEKLTSENANTGKERLLGQFNEDTLPIEASFKQTVGDPVATPKVGEEVPAGVTPKLESTTVFTMYGVDKNHLKEYVTDVASTKLADDQRVYSAGDPFFERFTEADGAYTAKLKTTTQSGPKVTEQDILEKSKGRKIGEVQTLIKSINGVSSVNVQPSYFWVRSVPNDENRITIELKVEE